MKVLHITSNTDLNAISNELLIAYDKVTCDNDNLSKEKLTKVKHRIMMIMTYLKNRYDWQIEIFKNLNKLIQCHGIEALNNTAVGKTAIVIGAGPSLNDDIDFLKKHQKEFVIISTNSSFNVLISNNIIPHFVVAGDKSIDTFKGISGYDTSKTVLVCTTFVNNNVVKAFDNILIWVNNNKTIKALFDMANRAIPEPLLEQGTIVTSAIDFGLKLGCGKIILSGIDLCYKDGKSHANGTFYDKENRLYDRQKEVKLIGRNGEILESNDQLELYATAIDKISKENENKIFSMTTFGYIPPNVKYISKEEIETTLVNKTEFVVTMPEKLNVNLNLYKFLQKLTDFRKHDSFNKFELEIIFGGNLSYYMIMKQKNDKSISFDIMNKVINETIEAVLHFNKTRIYR